MQRSLPIDAPRRQAGFSLVELLVAMLITLIVSGAIYGLMAGGQNAFRREPALVERQQNIRIALDLITRDLQNAGTGMLPATQVFSAGLDDFGPADSELISGQKVDALEILLNDGSCPSLTVCSTSAINLFTNEILPECHSVAGFSYVGGSKGPATSKGPDGLLWVEPPAKGKAGGPCGEGHLNTPIGQGDVNPAGGGPCTNADTCQYIIKLGIVRYEIAPEDPSQAWDALRNPWSLWRSETGRYDLDGTANTGPYIGASSPWQLIARGVEDLQVAYQDGTGFAANPQSTGFTIQPWSEGTGWATEPTTVVAGTIATMTRRVRVTLSARALALNIGGETTGAETNARRGSLTTVVSPRAALLHLFDADQWR